MYKKKDSKFFKLNLRKDLNYHWLNRINSCYHLRGAYDKVPYFFRMGI